MASKGKNNQLAKDFEFVGSVMTLRQLGGGGVDAENPCSQIRHKVIFKQCKQ